MADPSSDSHSSFIDRASEQGYRFTVATGASEIEQIQRLLYRTFVVEVPRYEDPGTGLLVDRFHEQNRYFVALHGQRVCGVLATHDQPPFSMASALNDPQALQRLGGKLLEARIFAIEPRARQRVVFTGLVCAVYQYAVRGAYDRIVIAGLASRVSMYRRMGFVPLGDPVLRGGEHFVPMALEPTSLPEQARRVVERWLVRTVKTASP